MSEPTEELDILLQDIRKAISENRLFLEKLAGESSDTESADDGDTGDEEGFEEL